MYDKEDCGCKNELNLTKLCVRKEKVKRLCAHDINAKEICTRKLEANHAIIETETVNNICVANTMTAQVAQTGSFNTNNLCAQNGTINTLCVNDLTVGNMNKCEKWRAAVTNAVDSTYTLGQPVNWTTVIDDPNGNVVLGPFSYTVPTSGYYVVTFNVDSSTLAGAATITGIPIGLLQVIVNGNPSLQLQAPFLSFSNLQSANLSALTILNAGDVLTMTYNVIVFQQTTGLVQYVGTIDLAANGSFPASSGFAIHYLSSLNCMPGQVCQICPPVVVPCSPVTVRCDCDSPSQQATNDDPCDSCQ
jgi:hypothetical protein